jgi:hypothetical protein
MKKNLGDKNVGPLGFKRVIGTPNYSTTLQLTGKIKRPFGR